MEKLKISWNDILTIFTSITIIAGGIKVLKGWVNPIKNLNDTVKKHSELLDNDNKRLIEMEKTDKILCKTQIAMLDHFITGNNIDKLKKVRTELQDFIINK